MSEEHIQGGRTAFRPVDTLTFEECYTELQALVEQFERGQMPLAESVERFERGMELLKRCNQQLSEAESRVDHLLRHIEPTDGKEAWNDGDRDRADVGDA